ncbi:MAG: 1-(5-phosphoribosyl)-5-[Firmicutes bacterium]|nr:1-(5-phosphoribosyl)-5-[(5-phosphoribosylamino)methylideneamino]imidazole-4-carboxamide isomerase [Bacillota bacterium]
MRIYPAVDIKNGMCVRLSQGRFDEVTVYEQNPVLMAEKWVNCGAGFLHIVDLDGALKGAEVNADIIKEIVKSFNVPVQTGGGIRTLKDIEKKLDMGCARVILGTAAVRDPELVRKAVELYGDKIAVGIDAKEKMVAISGWEEVSGIKAVELGRRMKDMGVKTIIYTDISRDGMMGGVNTEATAEMAALGGLDIIASGGVSGMKDLEEVQKTGAHGVIIGKALYQGAIDLKEAIEKYER